MITLAVFLFGVALCMWRAVCCFLIPPRVTQYSDSLRVLFSGPRHDFTESWAEADFHRGLLD
jgi:hypothetical protein